MNQVPSRRTGLMPYKQIRGTRLEPPRKNPSIDRILQPSPLKKISSSKFLKVEKLRTNVQRLKLALRPHLKTAGLKMLINLHIRKASAT